MQFLKGWKEDRHLLFAAYSFSRLSQERLSQLEDIFAAGYHGQLDTHLLLVSPIFQVAKKATLRVFFRDEIRENDSSFGPGQFLNPATNLAAPRLDRLTRMRYGAELNFSALIEDLTSRAPKALRGRGTRAILGRRPSAETLYESVDDLGREERWLLSLSALNAVL